MATSVSSSSMHHHQLQPQQLQWSSAPLPSPPRLPNRETVALFCDFLEHRLATTNMPLLRRMVGDFYAGHDQTLQEFVELSVNLVAVLPFEVAEPSRRAFAARILQQQALQRRKLDALSLFHTGAALGDVNDPHLDSSSCVFAFFQTRVGSKNLAWLRRIFREFCAGREDALLEFARVSAEAISILPVHLPPPVSGYQGRWVMITPPSPIQSPFVENQRVRVDSMSHPNGSFEDTSLPEFTDVPAAGKAMKSPIATSHKKRALQETAAAASAPTEHPGAVVHPLKRFHHAKPKIVVDKPDTAAVDQELELVRAEFLRVEAAEPWTRVFHADLESPFDTKEYPALASTLQQFLARHGHAIWERTFWMPFAGATNMPLLIERRKRQDSAKKVFLRRVIKPAFKLFGAQFFVDLDARATPHEGWWYLEPVEDLGALMRAKGAEFCVEYLRSQNLERFPDTRSVDVRPHARGHHVWSKSMWSSDQTVRHILHAIRRAKGTIDASAEPRRDGGGGGDDSEHGDDEADGDDGDGGDEGGDDGDRGDVDGDECDRGGDGGGEGGRDVGDD